MTSNPMRKTLTDLILDVLKEKWEDPNNISRVDAGTVQVRTPGNPPRYFNVKVSEKF